SQAAAKRAHRAWSSHSWVWNGCESDVRVASLMGRFTVPSAHRRAVLAAGLRWAEAAQDQTPPSTTVLHGCFMVGPGAAGGNHGSSVGGGGFWRQADGTGADHPPRRVIGRARGFLVREADLLRWLLGRFPIRI